MDKATYDKYVTIWAIVIFGFIILRALWMTFG